MKKTVKKTVPHLTFSVLDCNNKVQVKKTKHFLAWELNL